VFEKTEVQTPAEQIARPPSLGTGHTPPQIPQLKISFEVQTQASKQAIFPNGQLESMLQTPSEQVPNPLPPE
jgi:hypothetical protein